MTKEERINQLIDKYYFGREEDNPNCKPYCQDIAAAWLVFEKLRSSGLFCCLELNSDYDYVYDLKLKNNGDHVNEQYGLKSYTVRVTHQDAPMAICLGALSALNIDLGDLSVIGATEGEEERK